MRKIRRCCEHVTLHVRPGETVAVVGPSGGGKTTLCQPHPTLLRRDVAAASASTGRTCARSRSESLHHAIGVVQQDVFLFADTICEQHPLRPPGRYHGGDPWRRRGSAEIYDDIMAMPDGFDTYVGERGTLLSGGQKQRVSIARIFLKNPPILILDEATSALDSVTESKIQHALRPSGRGPHDAHHRPPPFDHPQRLAASLSSADGQHLPSRARTRSLCASAACMRPCAARRTSAARNDLCECPKDTR